MNLITTTELRTKTSDLVKSLLNGQEVQIIHRSKLIGTVKPKELKSKGFDAEAFMKITAEINHPILTDKEIDYKYNKDYGLPKEPIQKVDELDEEFTERKNLWQEKVDDIKMARNIEAKLAKPELEKLKSQIVLPEITKPETQAATNQLSEVQLKEIRENFLKALDSNYTKVEGFTTKVKDEFVDFPVQFKIPDEDKVAIKGRLTEGFDVDFSCQPVNLPNKKSR